MISSSGILGSIIGALVFRLLGAAGVSAVNLYSLIVAVIGAIVTVLLYHAVRRTHV